MCAVKPYKLFLIWLSLGCFAFACAAKKQAISNNEIPEPVFQHKEVSDIHDTSHVPLKTIRLAFHVFQHSSGQRSFKPNDEDLAFFTHTIERTNRLLAKLEPLEPLNSPEITSPYIADSRVRLHLDTIYFRVDDSIYDGFSKPGIVFSHARQAHRVHVMENPELSDVQKNNTLHVIVAGTWETSGGQASGIGNKNFILFKGWYNRFEDGKAEGGYNTFLHELGHSMGLHHQFAPHDCYQCKDLGCFDRAETNNLMSLWPSKMNAMSLCQFEIIHQYLSGEKGNIGDVVIENQNQ